MNRRHFLLEIGIEELPARFCVGAITQFKEKMEKWLKEHRLSFTTMQSYVTPRRLAILVEGLAEKQADMEEEARGPAKKIALDEDGNWTKAAEGFARGQGVQTDELFFKDENGADYVFAKKFISGKRTTDLLPDIKDLIVSLHFPQNMRWGSNDLQFARPIQWLVALYGNEVIPFEIATIHSGSTTYGHRFLGDKIEIEDPSEYASLLKEHFVIANEHERKEMIETQIEAIAKKHNWVVPLDEDLLQEVNFLVEYPTALAGSFDQSFLSLPKEVLITSMREHQRYFSVENERGEVLPYFITVRNGNDEYIENVMKGNEKVLRARLADGAFFFEEDQKMPIDEAVTRLEQVVYHEELGSIADKVRRIQAGLTKLNDIIHIDESVKKTAERIAHICKFDLVTQMVDEFPELQGKMGEIYARISGENEQIASAIYEHYKPRFAGDDSPNSLAATLVSIMDKLDTIVTCFSIGLIPTGSQDPYALRRQAAGIVQMLQQYELQVTIEQLLAIGLHIAEEQEINSKSRAETERELVSFFNMRVKAMLQDKEMKFDVIEAVLTEPIGHIPTVLKKAQFISDHREDETFKKIVESLNRVTNIAKNKEVGTSIEEGLFEKEEERALFARYIEAKEKVQQALASGDVEAAFQALAKCKPAINNYFDHIMVMAEDEKVKRNRLTQMDALAQVIQSFAQFQSLRFTS